MTIFKLLVLSYMHTTLYISFSYSNNMKKVQVGKDQEKAQSEKDSHSKNRGGKKPNQQSGTYTMKHIEVLCCVKIKEKV